LLPKAVNFLSLNDLDIKKRISLFFIFILLQKPIQIGYDQIEPYEIVYTRDMKKNQSNLPINNELRGTSLSDIHRNIRSILTKTSLNPLHEIINYYTSIILCMPGNVYWLDRNCLTIGCNQNVLDMFGLKSLDEFLGLSFEDMAAIGKWDKNQAESFKQDTIEVLTTGRPKVNVEEPPIPGIDGNMIYFLTTRVPLLNTVGETIGVVGISTNITERKQAEIELSISKQKAEAANRAKTEFLANMSHDVKTPLTGVVTVADGIRHDPTSTDKDRQKADMIFECGQQIGDFFNSCLELSKMEMQEWSSKKQVFRVDKLLKDIQALFKPTAESKGLTLSVEQDDALPAVLEGHYDSLYRIVLNLVGNALKFTERGGISLRAFLIDKIDDDKIHLGIEVNDTGMGIPIDKHQVIFEKMHRLTPSYEGKVEGSGMGLYIVDQYVKRMGGAIQVTSQVGQGSTFTLSLPIAMAPDTMTSEHPTAPAVKEPLASPSISIQQVPVAELSNENPRVLLVEDMPIIQFATQTMLNDAGFQVDIASSGQEAIDKFKSGKYGLIYMDIGLPDMSGYEVAKFIRQQEKVSDLKPTPIFALTGHGAVDVKTFCGESGMQGVLSKPLTREQAERLWQRYEKGERIDVPGLMVLEESFENKLTMDLSATATLLESEERMHQMLVVFIKELTQQHLPVLQDLVKKLDRKALRYQLHMVVGALCYLKLPRLHHAITELQKAALDPNQSMDDAYQHVVQETHQFIQEYQRMTSKD